MKGPLNGNKKLELLFGASFRIVLIRNYCRCRKDGRRQDESLCCPVDNLAMNKGN